jgi:hypothetical protein
MKRYRLSTLSLLIAIAALGIALPAEQRRHPRSEAALQLELMTVQERHISSVKAILEQSEEAGVSKQSSIFQAKRYDPYLIRVIIIEAVPLTMSII